jgi:hypothetical protein
MKALLQILFSAGTQRVARNHSRRVAGTEVSAKRAPARTPTLLLFPMSLTLEGYHVCGGPAFE